MQPLPFPKQRIIAIHQKGVVKLLTQTLFEGSKTGEIHHKSARIQGVRREPEGEAAAVAMHEATVPRMTPLAMAAGIALKQLAAAVAGRGVEHAVLQRTG